MDNSNRAIEDQTWECYRTASNNLEFLKIQISDIVKDYVLGNSVNLEQCIEWFVNEKQRYMLAAWNVQRKPKLSGDAYSKECWVPFRAEKQARNYTVYIKDFTKNNSGVITKEWFEKIFNDKFCSTVHFEWLDDHTCNESLSWALGYLKTYMCSSGDSIVLTLQNSSLENCLLYDKLIIKYGLNRKVRTKGTLMKILHTLHRILTHDKTYCFLEEELVNLTGILVSKNFSSQELNEVIKILCEIEDYAKITEKCLVNICNYFSNNKHNFNEIMHRYEMQLVNDGIVPEVEVCLNVATDWLICLTAAVQLIPREKIAYEMLNDLVGYLVDNKAKRLMLQEQELEAEIRRVESKLSEVSENVGNSICELISTQQQLTNVKKQLDYNFNKAKIVEKLDFNELLLLLGEKSKHSCYNVHMLNKQTVNMLIESARREISEGTSLALIQIIASLPKEMKMTLSVKHFLFHVPKEDIQLIIKLGLDQKLATEDIDVLCEIMYEILLSSENSCYRSQAVNVLEMHKEKLSDKVADLLELERNYTDISDISCFLKYVERGKPIPQIYFSRLLPLNKRTMEVLEHLSETSIQKVPKLIIRNLKSFVSEGSDPSIVLRSFKLLLKLEPQTLSDPEIRHLLRKPFYIEYILQHILDLRITGIPESLLKEIKNLPKTDYIKHFLDEVQINDIPAKLKNSDIGNEDKRKIIKSITEMKVSDSKNILEILEYIIRNNDHLRAEAFQALVKVIPSEYQINIILQYLDIKSLTHQDIAALKAKHCSLIPLLDEIIKNLYSTNSGHVELSSLLEMTLITELSFKQFCLLLNFAKYSNSEEVRSRIKRFIKGTNYGKEQIVDIMQYLEFLEGFCLQRDPELKTLHHCVEDGYGITEELLWLLTEVLQSKFYLRQRIESILFDISQRQEIPIGVWHSLLRAINAGNDINLSPEFIAFVANTCQAKLSNKALNSMFRQYENSFFILCGIENYAKERKIPNFVLDKVGELLINPNENIETRTLAAAILAHQEERCVNLPQIITVKLQQEFFSDLLCSKISEEYQILRDFLKDDDPFHEKFYALRGLPSNPVAKGILWKSCVNYCCSELSEEYNLLLTFVKDDSKSFHEKFYVFRNLSRTEAINKEIVKNFSIIDWRKEFFSYSLFSEMMQWEEKPNEFHVKEFRDNMNKVHNLLENYDKTHTSEAVYEALLQKQRTFAFGLRDGINMLIMLQSNAEAIDLLFNSSDNFVQMLKDSWLSYSLQMKKIEYTRKQLDELSKYLVFKTIVVEHFLYKLRGKSSIQKLTDFFQMLTESHLPLGSKEEFLMDGTDLLSANEWKSKLAQLLAQKMLQKKLQKFKDHKIGSKFNIRKTINNYFGEKNTCTEQSTKAIKKHPEKFLTYLLLSGWSEQSLLELVPNLDTEDKLIAFLWVLTIIYDYKLTIYTRNDKEETLSDIFEKYPAKCWKEKTLKMALYNSFTGTCTKTVPELIKEVCELNRDTEQEYLNERNLQNDFNAVMDKYNSFSELYDEADKIKFWEEDEIKFWTEKIRQPPNNAGLFEKIAVIKRAVEISCRFKLRDIQILAVLTLLQANGKKGCLAQINTGEGKTIIIAMIAAILSLTGHTVDVVTSSPELARPQSQEMQNFFSLMKITVAHNTEKNENTCYKADIVYGAASNFQGDILRDDYNQMGIRSERSCDIAIVDEVDSMLIDNRNYKVMLSSPMPAMNHLEPILAAIWVQIDIAASVLIEKNEFLYYKKDTGELIPILISKEEFIKKCARDFIKKLIQAENLSSAEANYPKIQIPKHLMRLVYDIQLHKWIDCALYAKYSCDLDKHYIIKDSKIIPVDASNTGIVQQTMHWNDGLHQFLQIKHGLRITPESLCTNFISNVAYFRRYEKIYGLTGTLGSTNAINLLKEVYEVSNVYLPPFKKEQRLELEPIIAMNEKEHCESIVVSSLSKLNNGRAVLIIAKYIAEAKKLHDMFILDYGYKKHKVKTYLTETDTRIIKENLRPGEVIIATNIAGRGTDIKLDHEIEQQGGLHVCITFLPSNLRTEKQNVGRTSRMGHKGTSQFIILGKHKSITEIRKERDDKEETALKNAKNEIESVWMHDTVFAEFCTLLKVVHNENDKNNDIKMKALEERFALWFKLQNKYFEGETKSIMKSFEYFRSRIEKESNDGKLIENPYFHVQIGNRFLEDEKYDDAIHHYTNAINMDPDFGENAYFNRGYACVAKYGHDCANHVKELYNAIEDFTKAKDIIERCEQYLHFMQLVYSEITEQIRFKSKIYAIQKSAIDKAIGVENEMKNKGDSSSESEENQKYLKGVILEAIEKNWNLKITCQKLQKVFKDPENSALYERNIAMSEAEIKESENNGCIGSFEVKMIKPPIKWLAFIGLTIIGVVQIVCGIVLHCCLELSNWAFHLYAAGINTIIDAIEQTIIKRDFNWKKWGIQKAVSLVTGAVVLGCSTIQNIGMSFVSKLKSMANTTGETAKNFWQKGFQKRAKAYNGQLDELINGLIECEVNRSMVPILQDVISSSIVGRLEDVLVKLLSDEYLEEFVSKVLEGLIGNENIEKYAIDIAEEICHKRRYSTGNVSDFIKSLECIPRFIHHFIVDFTTEVSATKRSLEIQGHKENYHKSGKCKQLSEEIATKVSDHVTTLVEKYIFTAFSHKRAGAEVPMKDDVNNDDDDDYIMQYDTKVPANEINEWLQKSTFQEMLVCLSDVAKIPIRLVDEKKKWLHTIGKDKVGSAIELMFNMTEIKKAVNNNSLFSEAAKLSGMPQNKLDHLIVKHLSVHNESRLKENTMLQLYNEELQRFPRIEDKKSYKFSYLSREQYNQIAYTAFSYDKLDKLSQTLTEGSLKREQIPAKIFHWHPNLMSCFKHTTSGAKQITEASIHNVVLKNPIKCTEKTCVLNIYPYERGKTNLGNF